MTDDNRIIIALRELASAPVLVFHRFPALAVPPTAEPLTVRESNGAVFTGNGSPSKGTGAPRSTRGGFGACPPISERFDVGGPL